jgi:hypothetical protein
MKETREVPFFWAHVVVTAIIAGVFIWIFRNNTGILWILVVATFIIWAIGYLGATFAAMIRAETQGPPPEHRLWKVDKRGNRVVAQQGVVAAIQHGELAVEPPHTRLEEI